MTSRLWRITIYYLVIRDKAMGMISAKFSDSDSEKLSAICAHLHIDKSEALRMATAQLWLALQIDKSFEERAGGKPKFLLRSGNSNSSSRESRRQAIADHLHKRTRKRNSE